MFSGKSHFCCVFCLSWTIISLYFLKRLQAAQILIWMNTAVEQQRWLKHKNIFSELHFRQDELNVTVNSCRWEFPVLIPMKNAMMSLQELPVSSKFSPHCLLISVSMLSSRAITSQYVSNPDDHLRPLPLLRSEWNGLSEPLDKSDDYSIELLLK